jgi:hypothetical protein
MIEGAPFSVVRRARVSVVPQGKAIGTTKEEEEEEKRKSIDRSNEYPLFIHVGDDDDDDDDDDALG